MGSRVLSLAAIMGVLRQPRIEALDAAVWNRAMEDLAKADLVRAMPEARAEATGRDSPAFERALDAVREALEASPAPRTEWPVLRRMLGDELLRMLLGVAQTSLLRYSAGQRPTPDPVARRLHFLATVVAELAGAYNDFGVRRWFARSRTALADRSPARLLRSGWDPDSPEANRVLALARSLRGSPAA